MTAKALFLEGRPVRLGPQIGKGGEGEVYALAGRADQALKLYTVDDVLAREGKITAMVKASLAQQTSLVSYPSAVVTDDRGRFAGFLMKLVAGHQPIHHLYAPGDRKAHFPGADYRFLVRTALNVARAIADVHARDCVIGDINHSGILVSSQAIVALIDADSFQISEGGKDYLCSVGVPEYTPPELQGKSLTGVRRVPNHDAFGLAVILFQLLCMGRHPFVGSYVQGEMPMERAIADYRFAYSMRRQVGMKPPPGTTLLSDFPPSIAQAFETAFDRWTARPTPAQWVVLLEQLEKQLRRCAANSLHYYPTAASECPWCRMERTVGVVLFLPDVPQGASVSGSASRAFDLAAVWAAIEAVPLPPAAPPLPPLPSPDAQPSIDAAKIARRIGIHRIWGGGVVIVSLGCAAIAPAIWPLWLALAALGVFRVFGRFKANEFFARRAGHADTNWQAILTEWKRRCGGAEVLANKQALIETRKQLERLPTEHRNRLANYDAYRRDFQFRAYLDKHRLADATIRGIGPGLKAALASWGIDSALGISHQAIIRIDGVGAGKARVLEAWRRQIEQRFVFDPRPNATDVREKDIINREVAAKREQLRARLARGANDLRIAGQAVAARSRAVDQPLLRAHRDRIQAHVDNDHVNASLAKRVRRMGPLAWAMSLMVAVLSALLCANLLDTAGFAFAMPAIMHQRTGVERLDPPVRLMVDPSLEVGSVNVRRAPSSSAPIVDHLAAGSPITGIGRAVASDGSQWVAYRQGDGALAYVSEALLAEVDTRSVAALADACGGKQWPAQILCHDPTLRMLKAQLDDRSRQLRATIPADQTARFVSTQKRWVAERNACQSAIDESLCLGDAYSRRLDELQNYGGTPQAAVR